MREFWVATADPDVRNIKPVKQEKDRRSIVGIRIYNTYTRRKEELKTVTPGKVNMYLCGLTVYNYFHIGNARPLIVFDMFRRYLQFRGYEVKYVVNITDVDDRIIQTAIEENVPAEAVASKYIDAYFEDTKRLGILKPDVSPKATDHIKEMISWIEKLIDRGYAYKSNGDVYYHVDKFEEYGHLSGKQIDELQAGARVEVGDKKHAPLDFALWKSAKPGEPAWQSPWGEGRPGWHIECSVMSMKYLGETFDIHAGGSDLAFPHHENEIAQSEGGSGKKFVNYWMHNGFVNFEGEKMSKSLGNFFTAREILEKYSPEVIRMFFLLKHYKSPINFSEERIAEARGALERIRSTMTNIEEAISGSECGDDFDSEIIDNIKKEFVDAMDDDFNTAIGISKIFDLVKEANLILLKEEIDDNDKCVLKAVRDTILEYNQFLGILPEDEAGDSGSEDAGIFIDMLLDVRKELREAKQWELADMIRDRLLEAGIEIKDKKDKTVWSRILGH